MTRHLHVVPSPDAWPPSTLRDIAARLYSAAGTVSACDHHSRPEVVRALADVVAAATAAEVLLRRLRDAEVPGQLEF